MFHIDPELFRDALSTHRRSAAALAREARAEHVFVQLGSPQARADIFRKDYAIPAFQIDEAIIGDIIIGPTVVNKVVSQSIAPGTVVTRGTQIEVTLAPPSTVPGRIIRDGHIGLANQTMEAVYNGFVRDNPKVIAVLNRNPDVEKMSTSDRAVIVAAAADGDLRLDDGPGLSISNMTTSLHLARTMMET